MIAKRDNNISLRVTIGSFLLLVGTYRCDAAVSSEAARYAFQKAAASSHSLVWGANDVARGRMMLRTATGGSDEITVTNQQNLEADIFSTTTASRQLGNSWYSNNNYNNNNNGNNNNNNNNNNDQVDWTSVGFDVTQYSVRYMGCSSVLSYSDTLAKSDSMDVLQAYRFAVFRLCPSFYCNPYSLTGCDADYGEYAVDLDKYLQSISTYDTEILAAYCTYCSDCFLSNSTTSSGSSCDASVCTTASSKCTSKNYTYTASEYYTCTEVTSKTDGKTYYLGPHCGKDSFSISVDVYSDQTCSLYVGNNVTVDEVLGESMLQNSLDYLPKKCVTCKETTKAWLEASGDYKDSNSVTEICEVLYEESAKCEAEMNLDQTSSSSSSYSSQSEEKLACNFIHNLANGTYNEKGEITQQAYMFNSTNWRNQAEYTQAAQYYRSTMSPWYIAGLSGVLVACTIMFGWACCLHRALARRNVPWRPKRGKNTDPTAISRQNSGIVMGRSRSAMNSPFI